MGIALPVVSGRETVRALSRIGFVEQQGRGKGSHIVVIRRNPFALITVPNHRELDRGTLKSILRHAGVSTEQFVQLLQ